MEPGEMPDKAATSHWSDAGAEAARERGRIAMETQPRATSARYDARSGRIIVELVSGATFAFPPELVQGLCDGTPEQLADVQVSPVGFGLHWESLDEDFTVAGLMNGVFGTARWMAQRAGRATSAKKAAASRENGKKGGRPRKLG
jgi:Protein of unknown function (DUF2442)